MKNFLKNILRVVPLFLSVILAGSVMANSVPSQLDFEKSHFSRYRETIDFTVQGLVVPKVVVFDSGERLTGAVLWDKKNKRVIPSRVENKSVYEVKANVVDVSSQQEGSPSYLVDGNYDTTFAFDSSQNEHWLTLDLGKNEQVRGISVSLADDVISPRKIAIWSQGANGEYVRVTDWKPYSDDMSFPQMYTSGLKIGFKTPHLLRIREIKVNSARSNMGNRSSLIFYGEDGGEYRVYFNPSFGSRFVSI